MFNEWIANQKTPDKPCDKPVVTPLDDSKTDETLILPIDLNDDLFTDPPHDPAKNSPTRQ